VLRDVAIRDVRSSVDANGRHIGIAGRKLEPLIRDKDGFELQALGGSEADVLDVPGCSVGVEPELHRADASG
jgi:hypothetical protein